MTGQRPLPLTAGALLLDGAIHTHTSVRGDKPPRLHPLIDQFLADLPASRRERYAGRCAEVILISDRLYAADTPATALTAMGARAALWGARVRVGRVREPGDPTNGEVQRPCRSCAALLEWLDVEVVQA